MIELQLSDDEHAAKKLKPEHLQQAVAAIRKDGFVVLHRAIDPNHIAVLRERMLADVNEILALDDVPYQFKNGHLQQNPPPFPPYLFRDVLANDLVVEVTQALLGEGVKNPLYSGNTCLPNPRHQRRRYQTCTCGRRTPTRRMPTSATEYTRRQRADPRSASMAPWHAQPQRASPADDRDDPLAALVAHRQAAIVRQRD